MQELIERLENIEKDNAYTVLQLLKEGPFGRTEKVTLGGGVAYIRKYFSGNSLKVESEYQILSKLTHPFLPKVYDQYELSGQSVMIEEYIEGVKLSEVIQKAGGLTVFGAVDIALKLCSAVDFLHRQKPDPVIHRDIKPDNIILQSNRRIKLIDFGAARNFKSGKARDTIYVGTLGYAPPEQFGFGQTDRRADIYAIGMTMIHMLTGVAPERGNKSIPAGDKIPPQLQAILKRATEFDPEKRYGSVTQLMAALKGLPVPGHGRRRVFKNQVAPGGKPPARIYPVYRAWPNKVKIALMPVHLFLLLMIVAVISRDIFTQTGFGRADDILQFVTDFVSFFVLLFPGYILGLNLFNLNGRVKFFHKHRLLKKIMIVIIIMFAGTFLLSGIYSLHGAPYLLAHGANSAAS
jgi:predicted Ser/Thr protein kinase